jgi:hypothetical protein
VDERQRLQRDLEDLTLRVRTLENVDTPIQRQLVADLRATQAKITEMDVQGTRVTQVRLSNIEEDMRDIKATLQRQEDNKLADRRVVLGALMAAAVAIALAIVQLVAG